MDEKTADTNLNANGKPKGRGETPGKSLHERISELESRVNRLDKRKPKPGESEAVPTEEVG